MWQEVIIIQISYTHTHTLSLDDQIHFPLLWEACGRSFTGKLPPANPAVAPGLLLDPQGPVDNEVPLPSCRSAARTLRPPDPPAQGLAGYFTEVTSLGLAESSFSAPT